MLRIIFFGFSLRSTGILVSVVFVEMAVFKNRNRHLVGDQKLLYQSFVILVFGKETLLYTFVFVCRECSGNFSLSLAVTYFQNKIRSDNSILSLFNNI